MSESVVYERQNSESFHRYQKISIILSFLTGLFSLDCDILQLDIR